MPPALRWVRAGASGVLLLLPPPYFNCPLPPIQAKPPTRCPTRAWSACHTPMHTNAWLACKLLQWMQLQLQRSSST